MTTIGETPMHTCSHNPHRDELQYDPTDDNDCCPHGTLSGIRSELSRIIADALEALAEQR